MNDRVVFGDAAAAQLTEAEQKLMARELEALRRTLEAAVDGKDLDVGMSCLSNVLAMVAIANDIPLQLVIQNLVQIWLHMRDEITDCNPPVMINLRQEPNG